MKMKRLTIALSLILLYAACSYAQRSVKLDGKAVNVEKWIKENFGHNKVPPFSFNYHSAPSASFIKNWKHTLTQQTASEDGELKYQAVYIHPKTGFRVECDITGYPDYQAVDWVLRFVNNSQENSSQISNVRTVDADFTSSRQGTFRLHYSNGTDNSRRDFAPHMKDFQSDDSLYMRPEGGRSSAGAFPFFNIESPAEEGVLTAIGWSGTWFANLKNIRPNTFRLQAGIERLNAFLTPNESIRTASVCLLFWQGKDRMVGHNKFRRFLLAHHSRKVDGQPVYYPISSGFNWGDPEPCNEYSCLTTEYAIALMQRTKLFGIQPEVFWLDAGWYTHAADYFEGKNWSNTVGNWVIDSTRFEHGFRPVSDYAHKMDAKFMVWFEPERVFRGTLWERLHPEWMIKEGDGESSLFNLANPEAVDWLCKYIGDFLEENGIDYYRQDFNINPEGFWKENDQPGREGITEIKYITGLYTYWDYLLKRFLTLLIDNCASGGRRLDYETALRSAPLWRTDYQYGECIGYQCHTYGLEFYLPQHGTGAYSVNPFDFRSSLGSAVVFNWKITQQGQSYTDMQKCMDEFKELRPYFYEDFYPLSGVDDITTDDIWLAYQLHKPADQTGYVVAFRREACTANTYTVQLSGLQSDAVYTVMNKDSGESFKKSGKELSEGLTLTANAPRSSLIIRYEMASK